MTPRLYGMVSSPKLRLVWQDFEISNLC